MIRPTWAVWLLGLAALTLPWGSAWAEARLPIFDTHLHYSGDAQTILTLSQVEALLKKGNVPRALVSSTPNEGTVRLNELDPSRFVPFLRPYRQRSDLQDWYQQDDLPGYLRGELERGRFQGIGEFHLFDEESAKTPEIREVVRMAKERDITLHVHSGAEPIRVLYGIDPDVKILWAHAGLALSPGAIGELLTEFPQLIADLSIRGPGIAPGGALDPAWRGVLVRHARQFTIGTDTYINPRWEVYPQILETHRSWLNLLPRDVAEAIAYRNAVRHFGSGLTALQN